MYYDFFEFRKTCQKCKKVKIAQNQNECLDCKARKIKSKQNKKPKINIVSYICKKSGGIIEPRDFNMYKK